METYNATHTQNKNKNKKMMMVRNGPFAPGTYDGLVLLVLLRIAEFIELLLHHCLQVFFLFRLFFRSLVLVCLLVGLVVSVLALPTRRSCVRVLRHRRCHFHILGQHRVQLLHGLRLAASWRRHKQQRTHPRLELRAPVLQHHFNESRLHACTRPTFWRMRYSLALVRPAEVVAIRWVCPGQKMERTLTPTMDSSQHKNQQDLPYKWAQTLNDVTVTIPVPKGTKGKDLDVVIAKQKLKVGLKGQPPIIDVRE